MLAALIVYYAVGFALTFFADRFSRAVGDELEAVYAESYWAYLTQVLILLPLTTPIITVVTVLRFCLKKR